MIIENSKDILNLLLGLSVVLVAIVFAWLLYQMGRTIKKANQIMDNVQKITSTFREKAAATATALNLFAKTLETVIRHVSESKANKNKKQK